MNIITELLSAFTILESTGKLARGRFYSKLDSIVETVSQE